MSLGESISILGKDLFRLTHVENTGVAFGVQAFQMWFLIFFNIAASIVLIYVLLKSLHAGPARYPRLMEIALALILGGALGNVTDRILFRRVTDFFDSDFPDFIMERWPVFNIADSAVTVGVTLWCVYLVFFAKTHDKKSRVIANDMKQSHL